MKDTNQIPIDRVAVRVVFKNGLDYEPTIRSNTTPILGELKFYPVPYNLTDYTGIVYGFGLEVLGYIGFTYHKNKRTNKCEHKWAVKCKCGRIERRNHRTISKQIRGAKLTDDRCESCKISEANRHYRFGSYVDENGIVQKRYKV